MYRRIFAILLICMLPLQSFAGLIMSEKMAGTNIAMSQTQMADGLQAPCHMASQPDSAADQDCCGSPAMCHSLCQISTIALPVQVGISSARLLQNFLHMATISFQSADLRAGFKPPIL